MTEPDSDDSNSSSSFLSSYSSKHSPPPSPIKIQVKSPRPVQDSRKRKAAQSEDAPPSKLAATASAIGEPVLAKPAESEVSESDIMDTVVHTPAVLPDA